MVEFIKNLALLTPSQERIMRYIANQLREGRQILLFITGNGGTGKTFLLKMIYTYMIYFMNIPTAKIATTGNAALLIQGRTIHSLLGINPNNIFLTTVDADKIDFLKTFGCFLFDEISMCPRSLYDNADKRLQSLWPVPPNVKQLAFGGNHMIFFGDFRQLPPVKDIQTPEGQTIQDKDLFAHPPFAEKFTPMYLEENVRQKGDLSFQNFLNTIADADPASLKPDFFNFLEKSKCKCDSWKTCPLIASGKYPILVAKNNLRDEVNAHVLQNLFPHQKECIWLNAKYKVMEKGSKSLLRDVKDKEEYKVIKDADMGNN